jgi:hypothetical protein
MGNGLVGGSKSLAFAMVLALTAALIWAAVAQAQELPAGDQYGDPTGGALSASPEDGGARTVTTAGDPGTGTGGSSGESAPADPSDGDEADGGEETGGSGGAAAIGSSGEPGSSSSGGSGSSDTGGTGDAIDVLPSTGGPSFPLTTGLAALALIGVAGLVFGRVGNR